MLDLAVLAALRDEDGYGYGIVRRLRAAGMTDVGDASVYGTLRRLAQRGERRMTAMPALDRRSDYVSAVAVELVDLAPDDRAELVEELDNHIAALLEDRPEVDLVTELGTPRAYAAELRAAAGLTGDARSRPGFREAAGVVSARVVAILPWLPGFLRTLRPAWWVLRGVLAASPA